ncbi:hypothetical protein DMENIID0001_124040 [Sergentomyia squamirostris]
MHEITINIDNVDVMTEFLNSVIDREMRSGGDKSENLVNWKEYGFSRQEELDLVAKSLCSVFYQYSRGQIDRRTLKSYFSYLSPDIQNKILSILDGRKEEFNRYLIFAQISSDQKAMLNFDWDVKCILGSSSSSSVQKLIASLTLTCRKAKCPEEKLHVEMNRENLDKLIVALESCVEMTSD